MSSLRAELKESLAGMALAQAPNAFAPRKPTPAKAALNALFATVECYATVTQIPEADAFMVKKIERLFQDDSLTGEGLGDLLMQSTHQTRPNDRPLPTVVFAAWVACGFAIQSIHAAAAGSTNDAWAHACDAWRCCGIAQGAAGELIAKHDFTHDVARVAAAIEAREEIGRVTDLKILNEAKRPKYAGLSKEAAAEEMADALGRSASTIGKKLGELFPGKAWKSRHIGR
jgi:hypothetical protein